MMPVRTQGRSDEQQGALVRLLAVGGLELGQVVDGTRELPPLPAEANHGRWIVNCDICAGAEIVYADAKFLCLSCAVAGRPPIWRAALFPKERGAIEELLAGRPMENRNWKPGEPLADLQRENAEHEVS